MLKHYSHYPGLLVVAFFLFVLSSCTTTGPGGFFGKKTPHEAYSDKITNAGLKETALGRLWFMASEESLTKSLSISIPYSEMGYFGAEKPEAVGVRFRAKRGEKLTISLSKKPATGFTLYLELWEVPEDNGKPKLISSADTSKLSFDNEVRRDGFYIVRLQPELLASGEYTLRISSGPSLAFPVDTKAKPRIGSFWGANRDNGARKHEGIDIFAPSRTPLVAAADGTVTRVTENNLGGKVIFLRPHNKDYTLYYAHLDEQLVQSGQSVKTGDTIGLMGNTGNARTSPPHLHFGIYTNSGAIDPLVFVDPVEKNPANITAPINNIGKLMRTDNKGMRVYGQPAITPSNYLSVDPNTLVQVKSATANWYKVALPDGNKGFVAGSGLQALTKPLRQSATLSEQPLLEAPQVEAPRKLGLEKGKEVTVLAAYKDFYYISYNDEEGWIPKTSVK